MSATTTKLLSSGEFCKLRYDNIPVKSTSSKVSFYTNNSKMPNFVTLLSQMSDFVFRSQIEESAEDASIHRLNPLQPARYSRQNLKLIHFKQMQP